MFVFSFVSLMVLATVIFILLSRKLASRMTFFYLRQNLLSVDFKKNTRYFIDLKKTQEDNIELFFKAVRRIEKKYKLPVNLCWLDETKLEEYTLIIQSINLTDIPCLILCNEQDGIEHEDVIEFF